MISGRYGVPTTRRRSPSCRNAAPMPVEVSSPGRPPLNRMSRTGARPSRDRRESWPRYSRRPPRRPSRQEHAPPVGPGRRARGDTPAWKIVGCRDARREDLHARRRHHPELGFHGDVGIQHDRPDRPRSLCMAVSSWSAPAASMQGFYLIPAPRPSERDRGAIGRPSGHVRPGQIGNIDRLDPRDERSHAPPVPASTGGASSARTRPSARRLSAHPGSPRGSSTASTLRSGCGTPRPLGFLTGKPRSSSESPACSGSTSTPDRPSPGWRRSSSTPSCSVSGSTAPVWKATTTTPGMLYCALSGEAGCGLPISPPSPSLSAAPPPPLPPRRPRRLTGPPGSAECLAILRPKRSDARGSRKGGADNG